MIEKSKRIPHIIFTRSQIESTVSRLAQEISRDYHGKHPIFIAVLKGSFIFTADLVRHFDFPLEIDFIKLSSYGTEMTSTSPVTLIHGLHSEIKDRDVIILEDIVDTGRTISFLMAYLREQGPSSIRLCALADKPARREIPVSIDYLGFTIPNKFIVGYGIDWDEKFRYLPDICTIEEEDQ